MILKLDIERVRTIDEVRDFMAGSEPVDFHLTDRRGAYDFVTRTLRRLNYAGLTKADKGVVRRFVAKVTGLSRAQSTRLIGQYRNRGHIRDRRGGAARPFERRYTAVDIRLLAEVDETLGGLCGPTTRRVMSRQYEVFGDERFERLAGLSNSHLYRMRQSTTYRRRRNPTTKTQATQVNIGERRKPHPQGRPGFLRVDSVHQGDLDGRKGVYEVNLVDEVTQYEFVAAVEGISERFLVPALEALMDAFPFEVKGFHSDNGSEYINYRVARLLRKLHVEEFTKSRPRRLQRQRPGREQERLGGASPSRPTLTSRAVTPPSSMASCATCWRRICTTIVPATSPSRPPTARDARGNATPSRTSPRRT